MKSHDNIEVKVSIEVLQAKSFDTKRVATATIVSGGPATLREMASKVRAAVRQAQEQVEDALRKVEDAEKASVDAKVEAGMDQKAAESKAEAPF